MDLNYNIFAVPEIPRRGRGRPLGSTSGARRTLPGAFQTESRIASSPMVRNYPAAPLPLAPQIQSHIGSSSSTQNYSADTHPWTHQAQPQIAQPPYPWQHHYHSYAPTFPNQSSHQSIPPPPRPMPTPNFAEEERINFELRRELMDRTEKVEQLKQILKLSEKRVAQATKELEEEDVRAVPKKLEKPKKRKGNSVAERNMLPTNQLLPLQAPVPANRLSDPFVSAHFHPAHQSLAHLPSTSTDMPLLRAELQKPAAIKIASPEEEDDEDFDQLLPIQAPVPAIRLSDPSIPVHSSFVPAYRPPISMPFLRPESKEPSPAHPDEDNQHCEIIGVVIGGQGEEEVEKRFKTFEEAKNCWKETFPDEEAKAFLPGRSHPGLEEYLFDPADKDFPQGKKRAANALSFYGNQNPAHKKCVKWAKLTGEEKRRWDQMWRDLRARQKAQISKGLIFYSAQGDPRKKMDGNPVIQVKTEPVEVDEP